MIPGALGFVWLIGWRRLYYPPELHPHISPGELQMIATDRSEAGPLSPAQASPCRRDLLKLPQTWGTIIAKTFTDPVWFFVTDWCPIYLVVKGIELQSGLIGAISATARSLPRTSGRDR
jgi:ACS family hexuronate transporter-like MFS transporter